MRRGGKACVLPDGGKRRILQRQRRELQCLGESLRLRERLRPWLCNVRLGLRRGRQSEGRSRSAKLVSVRIGDQGACHTDVLGRQYRR